MGEIVSMQKVSSLMKEMDLKSKQCKKRVFIQRESKRPSLPHLLHREFTQKQPNVFWVGDITQIKMGELNFYLCVIIDLFSRKVIAHRLSCQRTSNLVINTFNDAYELRGLRIADNLKIFLILRQKLINIWTFTMIIVHTKV